MEQKTVRISTRVVQMARLIRGLKPEEREQLKMLVPELREEPRGETLPIDLAELRKYIATELAQMGETYQPLQPEDVFLGGLTVEEYFALPEEERARIWDEAHVTGIDEFEERDVEPGASTNIPAGQECGA